MISEGGGGGKAAAAHRATVRFDWRVNREVVPQIVLVGKSLAADVAGKGFVLDVGFPETDNFVRITNCGNFLSAGSSEFLINKRAFMGSGLCALPLIQGWHFLKYG